MSTQPSSATQRDPVTIRIEGMSCGHCVAAVKGALADVQGLEVVEVKIAEARVKEHAPGAAQRGVAAIQDAGFGAFAMA
jgi:copper chaperone